MARITDAERVAWAASAFALGLRDALDGDAPARSRRGVARAIGLPSHADDETLAAMKRVHGAALGLRHAETPEVPSSAALASAGGVVVALRPRAGG